MLAGMTKDLSSDGTHAERRFAVSFNHLVKLIDRPKGHQRHIFRRFHAGSKFYDFGRQHSSQADLAKEIHVCESNYPFFGDRHGFQRLR